MREVDVAVVGAGPAGLAAAAEVAAGGARAVVIDAYPQPGGHYFKHLPPTFEPHVRYLDDRQAELRGLITPLARLGLEMLRETVVWGVFREGVDLDSGRKPGVDNPKEAGGQGQGKAFTLCLHGPHPVRTVRARCVLAATGAYDRPLVFPGWTLAGVITLGAAQMLMKGQGILPGQRVLVAGSGPLLLAVAAGLAERGAQVVAVLDLATPWDNWRTMPPGLWGQWGRLREAWQYWRRLRGQRSALLFRHTVFRALGREAVEAVTFGRVDEAGYPLWYTARTVEVDLVCVGLGFLPNTALTRHLGCQHVYDVRLDAFFPRHAATMETSVAGVFVAGDVTTLGGKEMARLQGRVAGLNILGRLGYLPPEVVRERVSRLVPAIRREQRFARLLREWVQVRPGLMALVEDDTIVCRCEEVTARHVRAAVADGARDIRGVKVRTRCGMGPCQGRYCEMTVGQLVAGETGRPREQVGSMTVRPPVVPVLAGELVTSELSRTRQRG